MLLNHLLLGLFGLWAIYFFLLKLILFKLVLNIILPLIIRYLLIPSLPDRVRPYADRALKKCDELCYSVTLEPKGPPDRGVYRTAMILSRVVDRDVVPEILDLAELWQDIHLASRVDPEPFKVTQREHSVGGHRPGVVYVEAELPATLPPKSLRSLTFSTSSCDQGHSNELQDVGTYRNSKTWFEVKVTPPDAKSPMKAEHVFHFPPRKIITNIHAGQDFKTHTVTWHYNDEDEEIRKLIRTMSAGWKVAITAWGHYPMWDNYVRSARIDCRVHTVRKM
ncbi:uncharacterized protein Z520_10209 [Fonsecaea multimorphosa CBS 102226]|uniref:Uncharacterized protein n=1 Tax=Fonsecaea multimorphosa CBS 102226 TaxID=1442371 RepID=A0A0D2JLJ1_9EURO|nr:uncharacterized protein Z520_10209 [Fonsecaea multimorphosa CBS 102226]KIX94182.1 hypothetical protein Z520_10209 [Fonsecaea multimorphosa CBS 102226]OAL19535.1 hypothetical protein AYO22_09697 [Fonsecaea multimorphosa]